MSSAKTKAEAIVQQHGPIIENLPHDLHPKSIKALDIESYLSNQTISDPENIASFLQDITYPLYFLDYETIMPAIPLFNNTRPFQHIPFQFSLHIQHSPNAELTHHEYLHKERTDPRPTFIKQLIQYCGNKGTVLVYSQAFEYKRNEELADNFPEYADAINAINARIIDLLIPFKQRWLYHPKQRSSASIKAVLPAFTDQSYEDTNISHGEAAMVQYHTFMKGLTNTADQETLWWNLTDYCQRDTYAMVLLLDVLRKHSA